MNPTVGNVARYRDLIALGVLVVGVLYVSFRKYSSDRVILCEAIGVSLFFIGVLGWAISGSSESSVLMFAICGLAAVFCAVLAVSFGVVNWVHRRRLRSHGK